MFSGSLPGAYVPITFNENFKSMKTMYDAAKLNTMHVSL